MARTAVVAARATGGRAGVSEEGRMGRSLKAACTGAAALAVVAIAAGGASAAGGVTARAARANRAGPPRLAVGARGVVVNDLSTSHSVTVFQGMQPVATVPVAGPTPLDAVVTPDDRLALVTNPGAAGSVQAIDLAASPPRVEPPIRVSGNGFRAVAPDGRTVWDPNPSSTTITLLDLATTPPTPQAPFSVGFKPVSVAATPDGKDLWVVRYAAGAMRHVFVAGGRHDLGPIVKLGTDPLLVTLDDAATVAYVTFIEPRGGTSAVDLTTGAAAHVRMGSGYGPIAVDPADPSVVYFADQVGGR